MGKRWPALDVAAADEAHAERIQALADDFAPTAIEERPDGLRLFFSTAADRDRAAGGLRDLHVSPIDVPDDDWAQRSQENLTPISVGRLIVSPPWHAGASSATCIEIVILPSMGFGTGHHATTRLCLAALQAIDVTGATVLDAGTGSGVLAMAAVHLGASHALGVDDDPDAIQSAIDNLALNPHLPADRITFAVGDLMSGPLTPSDIVTANLTGGLLIRAASRLQDAVNPGGMLIMSGLQTAERDEVWRVFEALELVAEAEEAGWSTITGRKRSK